MMAKDISTLLHVAVLNDYSETAMIVWAWELAFLNFLFLFQRRIPNYVRRFGDGFERNCTLSCQVYFEEVGSIWKY